MLVTTDAIVLHAFDYRETSRILRLATRDAGVISVIARGARRPKNRFGSALDLFAEGTAQLVIQGTRTLHTLSAFDVLRARPALAESWARFAAANALSEILLRFASDDTHPELFTAFAASLSMLEQSNGSTAATGIAGAWAIVAELGFAPSLDQCARCGIDLESAATVRFAHREGGALCESCATGARGTRELPAPARALILAWLRGAEVLELDEKHTLAHLRLLREFLHEHLADNKPLRAFAVWERGDWRAQSAEAGGQRDR